MTPNPLRNAKGEPGVVSGIPPFCQSQTTSKEEVALNIPDVELEYVPVFQKFKKFKNDLGHTFLIAFIDTEKRHFRHLAEAPVGTLLFSVRNWLQWPSTGAVFSRKNFIPIANLVRSVMKLLKGLRKWWDWLMVPSYMSLEGVWNNWGPKRWQRRGGRVRGTSLNQNPFNFRFENMAVSQHATTFCIYCAIIPGIG